jgi:hypothetical protein
VNTLLKVQRDTNQFLTGVIASKGDSNAAAGDTANGDQDGEDDDNDDDDEGDDDEATEPVEKVAKLI